MWLLLVACSEYGLEKATADVAGGEDSEPFVLDTGGAYVEDEVPCDATPVNGAGWSGSPPFAGVADPTDPDGIPWYAPDFDAESWSAVSLPDRGTTPAGQDRTYRASFVLDAAPAELWLDLQSDDGLWLYVNGEPVGHWGGAWQEEGCVNDEAMCLVTVTVPPVDVAPWLVAGENLVAARVSNAIEGAFFGVAAICPEP